MKKMFKKLISGVILSAGVLLIAGCSKEPEVQEPQYADEDFINDMSKGLQARWDLTDKDEKKEGYDSISVNSKEYQDMMVGYVDAELDIIQKYTDEKFEDKKLQETAIKYINLLEKHKEICSYMTVDYVKYDQEFQPIYNERSKIIEQMVNDYDMTVDKKHQATLDDFLIKSQMVVAEEKEEAAVQAMLDNIQFQLVEQQGNMSTYQAVVENTTDIDFKSLQVNINLLSADGVIIETTYDQVSAFNKGTKVQFEIYTDKEFASTQVTANWWEK